MNRIITPPLFSLMVFLSYYFNGHAVDIVKVKIRPQPLRLIGPNTVRACQDSAASAHRRAMWPASRPTTLTFSGPKRARYPFSAGFTGERPMF